MRGTETTRRWAGYDEFFVDRRDALPTACIEFIERKRDRPFFAVASFINPHDICFAYSAYKGASPKSKSSVEHLYRQAAALPRVEHRERARDQTLVWHGDTRPTWSYYQVGTSLLHTAVVIHLMASNPG